MVKLDYRDAHHYFVTISIENNIIGCDEKAHYIKAFAMQAWGLKFTHMIHGAGREALCIVFYTLQVGPHICMLIIHTE